MDWEILPQKVICEKCGHVLYEGSELKPPDEIIQANDGKCPGCGKKIAFVPTKVMVQAAEETGRRRWRLVPEKGASKNVFDGKNCFKVDRLMFEWKWEMWQSGYAWNVDTNGSVIAKWNRGNALFVEIVLSTFRGSSNGNRADNQEVIGHQTPLNLACGTNLISFIFKLMLKS